MVTSNARITTHGALFTGQATRELRKTLDVVKEEVGKRGETLVKQRLGNVLKSQNTKYGVGYVSQIRVEKVGKFNDQLISDGGVVYGPWLESGKYSPPRRFKGYKTFRRTRTRLKKIAIPLAQRRVDRLVARWNS